MLAAHGGSQWYELVRNLQKEKKKKTIVNRVSEVYTAHNLHYCT